MKVLFDTNVVLDVLLNREPYAEVAIALFSAVEAQKIQGFLCATTITTVDYLATKVIGRVSAKVAVAGLLELFAIAEVNQATLQAALSSDFADFEDAVLYYAGSYAGVDGFVTRNGKDFKLAAHPIYTPPELLKII
jgi:predicted nucleic acid-binding protein